MLQIAVKHKTQNTLLLSRTDIYNIFTINKKAFCMDVMKGISRALWFIDANIINRGWYIASKSYEAQKQNQNPQYNSIQAINSFIH